MFPPCSLLFPLFSFILEYFRVAVDLVWIFFLSFHLCFPEFLISCQFLKNPRKKCFSKNSRKFFLKFYIKKWGREAPETPQGDPPCDHTTWWRGQGQAALWLGVGPLASTYLSTLHITLSPEISSLHSSNPCSCCSCS
jgi:hypothetical protein